MIYAITQPLSIKKGAHMRSFTWLCCCLVEGLDELFEISLEALADFGMLEGNFAVCLHDAELVAHIVTDSVEVISNEVASCAVSKKERICAPLLGCAVV